MFVKAMPGEAGRSSSKRFMVAASVVIVTAPPVDVDVCRLCRDGFPVMLILRGRTCLSGFSSAVRMDEIEDDVECADVALM